MSIHVIADAAAGPFAAACAVLAFAGASKIARPAATRPAVAALGLPNSPTAVRILGIGEASVAVAGLAAGRVAAAAVVIVYAALAVAAWRLLVRSPGTACGCLGPSDAPVTKMHVMVNVAGVMAAALATGAGSPLAAASAGVWSTLAFVALVACCASLVASMLESLPALAAAIREDGSR